MGSLDQAELQEVVHPLVERGLRNSAKKQEYFLKLVRKSRKTLIPPVSRRILFPDGVQPVVNRQEGPLYFPE